MMEMEIRLLMWKREKCLHKSIIQEVRTLPSHTPICY